NRFLKFLNPAQPKSTFGKVTLNILLPIFLVGLFYSYHYLLFKKQATIDYINLYHNEGLTVSETKAIIDSAQFILAQKNIRIDGSIDVFLTANQSEYNWATLYIKQGSVGLTLSLMNRIILNGKPLEYRT